MSPSVRYLLMKLKLGKLTIVTYRLLALPFYCHILLLCQWLFLLWVSVAERRSGPAMRQSQGLSEPPADQINWQDYISFFQPHSLFLIFWIEIIQGKPHSCGSCITSLSSYSWAFHSRDLTWLFVLQSLL